MAAVTILEMLAAEASAFASSWTEEGLLKLAGERLGIALGRFFPQAGTAIGYLGKGHNAGDTLVALRVLRDRYGWRIATRNAFPINECAPLTRQMASELGSVLQLDQAPSWRDLPGPLLLLDGLLGSGTRGALRDPLLSLAQEMEWLRQHAGARVAAVDLPSGMDPDSGLTFPGAVVADATFMIGNAKRGLLMSHAANFTGALALVPMEVLSSSAPGDMELISPQTLETAKARRPFDFHKGLAGRVSILAGSPAYTGAAVLAATGALRAGAGLVTLHVPESTGSTIAARCPPEIIVREVSTPRELLNAPCDALVIGCGLGDLDDEAAAGLFELIGNSDAPCVVDADALNLVARHGKSDILGSRHVITPHPGEFKRLAPDLAALPREEAARAFAERVTATLLLKGCRTLVTRRGEPLWCNSTGSPGMATGGQGDLLAGVIGALLAAGNPPLQAAALAAWVCGRAAECALDESGTSEESLTPGDVALHLGAAFRDWRESRR